MRLLLGIIAVVAVPILATVIKDQENKFHDLATTWDFATDRISESKQRGVFVCDVLLSPMSTGWQGTSISFDSAWIERRVKTKPYWVWWYQRTAVSDDYYLIVHCRDEALNALPDVCLFRSGAGSGFDKHGTTSYDNFLDSTDFRAGQAALYIGTSFDPHPKGTISASWKQ